MKSTVMTAVTGSAFLFAAAFVQAQAHPAAEAQVLELSKQAIALRSVRGEGNQTPTVAELFKKALLDVVEAKPEDWERDPKLSAAMQAFATNPADEEAIAVLRANPATVGTIGTTCVPTMVQGGHAINALPQRVTANVNCRVFPGHTREEIMAELERVAGVPSYGAPASMSKRSDEFSHGLNERVAFCNISPGVTYYLSVYRDLSSQ